MTLQNSSFIDWNCWQKNDDDDFCALVSRCLYTYNKVGCPSTAPATAGQFNWILFSSRRLRGKEERQRQREIERRYTDYGVTLTAVNRRMFRLTQLPLNNRPIRPNQTNQQSVLRHTQTHTGSRRTQTLWCCSAHRAETSADSRYRGFWVNDTGNWIQVCQEES